MDYKYYKCIKDFVSFTLCQVESKMMVSAPSSVISKCDA